MTTLEAQFRDLHPEFDTLIEHSPLRARFLLLTFLYGIQQKEESVLEETISKLTEEKETE